jgi:hypothetical protein
MDMIAISPSHSAWPIPIAVRRSLSLVPRRRNTKGWEGVEDGREGNPSRGAALPPTSPTPHTTHHTTPEHLLEGSSGVGRLVHPYGEAPYQLLTGIRG